MSASHKPQSSGASSDIRKAIEAMAVSVTCAKGAIVFHQGDEPKGVYLVRKGAVRMTIKADKSEILMRVAHEGSVLGLPAVMSDHAYSLTAKAAQACELGFVERHKVLDLVRRKPVLGLEILQMLSDEVRTARIAMASSRARAAKAAGA
jgi:CRP-like cAMP-binding protein